MKSISFLAPRCFFASCWSWIFAKLPSASVLSSCLSFALFFFRNSPNNRNSFLVSANESDVDSSNISILSSTLSPIHTACSHVWRQCHFNGRFHWGSHSAYLFLQLHYGYRSMNVTAQIIIQFRNILISESTWSYFLWDNQQNVWLDWTLDTPMTKKTENCGSEENYEEPRSFCSKAAAEVYCFSVCSLCPCFFHFRVPLSFRHL